MPGSANRNNLLVIVDAAGYWRALPAKRGACDVACFDSGYSSEVWPDGSDGPHNTSLCVPQWLGYELHTRDTWCLMTCALVPGFSVVIWLSLAPNIATSLLYRKALKRCLGVPSFTLKSHY